MDRAPSLAPDPVGAIALLGEPNRRRLYAYVTSVPGPVSRDEAAEACGISRDLAAHHLDRLVEGGLLSTESRRRGLRRGPGAGRPAKLYRRAVGEIAVSLPERHYETAATTLAAALEQTPGGPELVTRAAIARGRALGLAVRRTVGARAGRRRVVDALLETLGRAGYAPRVDASGGAVCLANCPYDALANQHRELTCGMNRAWAEGLAEGIGEAGLAAEAVEPVGRCCARFHLGTGRTGGRLAPTL